MADTLRSRRSRQASDRRSIHFSSGAGACERESFSVLSERMRSFMCVACLLSVVTISLALVACGDDSDSGRGSEFDAVATTTHVGDLVRNVGGGRVEVHTLLGPKADPHGYEPKPSDVKAIAEAGLVVRSGGDLDEWLDDLIDNAGGDAQELTLIDSVRTIKGSENGAEETDPHWWQDPRNAILAVRAIERALVDVDPEGRATFERNADAYV